MRPKQPLDVPLHSTLSDDVYAKCDTYALGNQKRFQFSCVKSVKG